MTTWTFDGTVNVEGITTAAAAVGAATGLPEDRRADVRLALATFIAGRS